MAKRSKRLQKLRQNPNNVSLEELRRILESEGFMLDHVRGSHYVFRAVAGGQVLRVVVPFARPIKPVYVRQALAAIDTLRQSKPEDEESEDDGTDDN